ncbi:MAG: Inner rane lipoprotein YiaD precursor [Verrucomicrobiota bacterium]
MKKTLRSFLFLAAITLSAIPSSAADIPGAKDPLGLKRYEGTRITYYNEKAYDAYELPIGKMTDINFTSHKGVFEKSLKLEGKVTRVSYASSDPSRTSLEVYRNYKTELADKGWSILWEGSENELSRGEGFGFAHFFAGRPGQTFEHSHLGAHFIAAKKDNAHLGMYIVNFNDGYISDPKLAPAKGAPIVAIDVVESAAMDEKMVVVKAEEMASKISDLGGINLYGFYFDFNSATLKGESAPTLDEVAKLIEADSSLRLLVVGHTDAVGAFDYNIDLSKKRAASVVAALAERVPAAASRLTACGVGYQCPIANNSSEGGRAKNRRVALVKVEK